VKDAANTIEGFCVKFIITGPCQAAGPTSAGLGVDDVMGALKMQDKTLQDRTMTDKRSTMPE